MKPSSGCLICGADLRYGEHQTLSCYYCRQSFESNVSCKDGHFVCDSCHSKSGNDLIETYCLHSESCNPFLVATGIMRSEAIAMHGPEHHFLVPAVLISAYCNKTGTPEKAAKLASARIRAEKVPGGYCGTHGTCGAGVGAGIFTSIITGSTPLAKDEWKLSNLITGKCLVGIAEHGGPRCCKRDVYLSLKETVRFVEFQFGVRLEHSAIVCEFSSRNKECIRGNCPFYKG